LGPVYCKNKANLDPAPKRPLQGDRDELACTDGDQKFQGGSDKTCLSKRTSMKEEEGSNALCSIALMRDITSPREALDLLQMRLDFVPHGSLSAAKLFNDNWRMPSVCYVFTKNGSEGAKGDDIARSLQTPRNSLSNTSLPSDELTAKPRLASKTTI
jgi:hypothetical protein